MPLDKKLKNDILTFYKIWLDAYLNGNTVDYNSYFDEYYHFIGSTSNKAFLNREETTKFFKENANQLVIKPPLENEHYTLEQFGNQIFITHIFDAWFLNGGDYSYHEKFRFSSILHKKKTEWKFIYQHLSIPYSHPNILEANEDIKQLRKTIQNQTSELQAKRRELEIEVALEKVRSRTMAMQHSDELQETSYLLDQQVRALGIKTWGCAFNIYGENESKEWFGNEAGALPTYTVPRNGIFKKYYEKGQKGETLWIEEFSGKACLAHYETMSALPVIGNVLLKLKETNNGFPTYQIDHVVYFKYGYLLFITKEQVPEAHDIFKRFANVFEQTYTRFLDLKKAEQQTKEAKIEASLEKVRTVALTLTKSDDMLDVAQVLYEQLLVLGFTDMRNAIIDIHNDDETFLDYDYSHDMSSAVTLFSFYGDHVIEQQIKKVESSNDAFFEIELKGDELKELIETRLRNGEKDDPRLHTIDHLTYNLYSFGNGAIGISNFGILSDEKKAILKRFRNVFTFAYKRYTDLAKAEEQAREAKLEASLEKVRSEALGIEESTDLLNIAKALYEQLLDLGFNDIRNAIIDVNNEDDETFLDYDYSHEMGGTITLMAYDDDPTLVEQVKDIANSTDSYSEMVLKDQQLIDLINMRRNNGEADDPRLMEADSVTYILYAFGNGAVGISNFGTLTSNQKNILGRFRVVFTFAYQRFKDLQIKEEQAAALLAEKLLLEKTLTDLQETQEQLIQSEKMASLGELTAGIAHEIQNPLNFVNNFSDLSKELLDEMLLEIKKGDFEEAKLIMVDIIDNLEKINHHGKRADGIVKAMLQHSRSSGNKKENININSIAEEYLRLAYHGLRAKDKSFNAELITDFDESITSVNIVPQDIGRVILNLLNNAFYAVHKKKEHAPIDFIPTVGISTKQKMDKLEIKIKDNGNGMTETVKEKIFQPFFTTKPTGEGTGLGLSLSYDIVTNGHEGELTVESKQNEGTTFTILLPIAPNKTAKKL